MKQTPDVEQPEQVSGPTVGQQLIIWLSENVLRQPVISLITTKDPSYVQVVQSLMLHFLLKSRKK
jgi:hypothetical protein